MPDYILDDKKKQELDSNIREMIGKGASKDDVMRYSEDFGKMFSKKKDGSTVSPVSPSPFVSESPSQKKARHNQTFQSDAQSLEANYKSGLDQAFQQRSQFGGIDMFGVSQFQQSREGKAGKIVADFQSKGTASKEDLKYLNTVAPKAAAQVVFSGTPEQVKLKIQKTGTVDDADIESFNQNHKQIVGDNILVNTAKFYSDQNKNLVSTLTNIPGFDPGMASDPKYLNNFYKSISASKTKELAALDAKFPEKVIPSGVASITVRENGKEYEAQQKEINERYAKSFDAVGRLAASKIATPDKDPLEIGLEYLKFADPNRYSVRVKAGRSGIDRDIAAVGSQLQYANNTDLNQLKNVKASGDNLDSRFPDKLIAETKRRLGAELYKSDNWFLNLSPSVNELDEAAKQLPEKNREAYYKYIRETEQRIIGTDIPQSGAINQLGMGVMSTVEGTNNFLASKVGARGESDIAKDALNAPNKTRFEAAGAGQAEMARIKELENKAKSGANLSVDELEEKRDLETYTNIRSTGQKVIDGSFNLGGQVLFQALGTKGLAGLGTAAVKGAGLLKTAIPTGLATEEAIASSVMDFGISQSQIANVAGAMVAYSSSYDGAAQEAIQMYPDDANKRSIYTNTVAGLNAVTERIFKDEKIFDAFKRTVKPNIGNLVNEIATGKLTKELLQPAITKIVNDGLKIFGQAGVENLKETTEEVATSVGTSVTKLLLSPEKFNYSEAVDDAVTTATTMFTDGGLVALVAGVKGYRENKVGIGVLSKLGVNKTFTADVKSVINAQLLNGDITKEEADKKINVINKIVETNTVDMPRVNALAKISDTASKKYGIALAHEKLLKQELDATTDEALKSKIQEDIKASENIRKSILNKEVFVDDNYAVVTPQEVSAPELSIIESLTPEQIQVTGDSKEFANQMQSAQGSLGRAGMSVSPYAQEDYDQIASEGGKFLRAAGNKILALLKPNGEMVSLVKDATVKTKGAAQAMISKMKDMGGLFMDNYDIYLTPIYEKAGYKVVARVPFNEEYAPEGWDAEDSPLKNKPDVVFMVRKDFAPAQDQTFTDYEEAQNYTQGIVDNAVAQGIAKLPEQASAIDTALGQAIPKATKSLEKAGIKFQVVDGAVDTEYAKAARGNQALFLSDDGTIIIDRSKLQNDIEAGLVVWHEASHPVMNIIRNTNKPLYDAVVRGINEAAAKNEGVKGAIDWAKSQEQYDNADTQNDEAIVETIGRINSGLIDVSKLDTGLRQKLIDFVNSIAKVFGIDPILNDTDIAAFKKTVSQVADALKTGRDIGEIVGQKNVGNYKLTDLDGNPITEGATQSRVSGWKNLLNGITFKYLKDSERYNQLKNSGYITEDRKANDFSGMPVILHVPDHAFTGEMIKDGEVIVEGKGGVFYPLRFHDLGYFWASTKSAAAGMAAKLNAKRAQSPDGKIRLMLLSAPQDKLMSSTAASNSMLDILMSKAFDRRAKISKDQVIEAYRLGIEKIKGIATKKGKDGIKFDGTVEDFIKTLPRIGKSMSADKFKSVMRTWMAPTVSNFDQRKQLNERVLQSVAELVTDADAKDQVFEFFKGVAGAEMKTTGGRLSMANLMEGFSKLFAEPMLKGEAKTGDAYAVIELDGDVDAVETGEHESYPFAIKSKDKNKKPVVHILQDRKNWTEFTVDPATGKIVSPDKYSSVLPPSSGISNIVTINAQASVGNRNLESGGVVGESGSDDYLKITKVSDNSTKDGSIDGVYISADFGRNGGISWEIPLSQIEKGNKDNPDYLIVQSIDRNKSGSGGIAPKEDSKGEGTKAIAALFAKYPSIDEILYDDYASFDFWQRIGGNSDTLKRKEFFKYYASKFPNTQASVGNRNLAPNGKPSNLTPKQYEQVRTPQFKNWFGDWENDPANASKVVDENGEPRVVFHGTNATFDEFKKENLGTKNWLADSARMGFFFAGDKSTSEAYTGMNSTDMIGVSFGAYDDILNKYKPEQDEANKAVSKTFNELLEKEKKRVGLELEESVSILRERGLEEELIQTLLESLRNMRTDMQKVSDLSKEENDRNGNNDRLAKVNEKVYSEIEEAWKKKTGSNPQIMELYLNIRNPLTVDYKDIEDTNLPSDIQEAIGTGKDGVIFNNLKDGAEADDIFVAFEPNQIKSATGNSGQFSTTDNRIQASVGNRDIINGFYSPIEDRINTFKQPKASVQKWKEIVGVKSDEAVFSGLSDWLGGMKPDRQLSKEEVSKFIKDNRIEIKEVVKGKGAQMTQSQMDDVYNGTRDQLANMDMIDDVDGDRNNPLDVWYNNPTDENYDALGEFTEERGIDLNFIADAENDGTKYSQYQLPGGENYKEVLITLPNKKIQIVSQYNVIVNEEKAFLDKLSTDMPTSTEKEKFEEIKKRKEEARKNLPADAEIGNGGFARVSEKEFNSSHFDQPNIITHLRMNTRTDADGKKVLFLEEVQSDWGQKGKREGFKKSKAEVESEFNDADKKLDALNEKFNIKYGEDFSPDMLTPEEYSNYSSAATKRVRLGSQLDSGRLDGISPAPYVTNTNAWVKLGLKVALKEAVKQGADRIAWTTGEQQNERYNLSKQVDEIKVLPQYGGEKMTYAIQGFKDGDMFASHSANTISELEGIVGKDIASKVAEKGEYEGELSFKGKDLQVGGKGMKAFYGDANNTGIVGNVAKALVKELTGKESPIISSDIFTSDKQYKIYVEQNSDGTYSVTVGNDAVYGDSAGEGFKSFYEARHFGIERLAEYKKEKNVEVQPAIDITPELAQSVQQGMPQFSVGNRSEDDLRAPGTGKERNRALSSRFGDLDPETQAKIEEDATIYFQKTNKQTAKAVEEFIDGQNIIDMADYVMSNPDIPEVSRVWMAAEVAKRLNAEIAAAKSAGNQPLVDALTDKQSAIYNEYAKKATGLGQAVQAFIAFKNDPNAVAFFLPKILKQLKNAGVENVTEEQKADIVNLLKDVNSAADGLPKDKAIIKLSHYLGIIAPMKPMDVLQALWYAKILSGITTQSTNFFANVFNTVFELPAVAARVAIMNKAPLSLAAGVKGFGSGIFKGAVAAADIMRTGVRSKEVDKYFAESPLEYFTWSKWLGKTGKAMDFIPPVNFGAWKFIGRMLAATDALFSTANQEAIANMLAYAEAAGTPGNNNFRKANALLGNTKQNIDNAKAQATAEGFDPKSLQGRRRVIEIVAQGRKGTQEADAIGKRITMNYDPDGWTKPLFDAVVALQRSVPVIKMVIPFARIVANLTENGLNYSPLGLVKAATGKRNPFNKAGEKLSTEERVDLFNKFALGMTALVALSSKVGDDDDDWFEITAGGSNDVQKKYELQKGGWRPYTITLKDGTKINYKDWPIAGILAGVGHIRDAKKYSFDDSTQMGLYATGFFQNFYDKSLLSGLQDFFGIFNVEAGRGKYSPDTKMSDRAKKYAAQQVRSVAVSNLAQQTGKMYSELVTGDPQRDAKTFAEVIYRDLPMFNDGIRPIIDVFGDEVKYNTTERLTPKFSVESDEMIKWLNENKFFVGVPQKKNIIAADGSERPMTDDEYYEYRKLAGQKSKEWIGNLMNGIKNDNRDISESFFESGVGAARDLAYVEILSKYGFK